MSGEDINYPWWIMYLVWYHLAHKLHIVILHLLSTHFVFCVDKELCTFFGCLGNTSYPAPFLHEPKHPVALLESVGAQSRPLQPPPAKIVFLSKLRMQTLYIAVVQNLSAICYPMGPATSIFPQGRYLPHLLHNWNKYLINQFARILAPTCMLYR